MKKPWCKNCGDEKTFAVRGERSPDYQRETIGWCQRCLNLAKKVCRSDDEWNRCYHEIVAMQKQEGGHGKA
jgi:hypothetical protein